MPPNAALDAFDWRVSMARVASDGPFSRFLNIDRTLAVLDGNGVRLTIDDASPVLLDKTTPPVSFRGDDPVHAVCVDGPITDFNVMTRRSAFHHVLDICDVTGHAQKVIAAGTTLILCHGGELRVTCGASDHHLADNDALVIETTTPCVLDYAAPTPVRLYIVRIFKTPAG